MAKTKLTTDELHAIRNENFDTLIAEAGSIIELSRRAGYDKPAYLYQVHATKPNSKGKTLQVGTRLARKLEKAMGKPEGWMDELHEEQVHEEQIIDAAQEISNNLKAAAPFTATNIGTNQSITLAWTGASGFPYGLCLLECLLQAGVQVNLVYSDAARIVAQQEANLTLPENPNDARAFLCAKFNIVPEQLWVYAQNDWFAPIASGSAVADAMVICPASMGTVAAIAHGTSDTLLERAADVSIKEKRPVIIVPRETPLSPIHLENMLKLAKNSCTILPPTPAFYHNPQNVADLVDFVVARILDHLHIAHNLSARWSK